MRRPRALLVALALWLACGAGFEAIAAPQSVLDAYVILTRDGTRIARTRIDRGDVGVEDGVLALGRGVEATTSQVLAPRLRLSPTARCKARFGTSRAAAAACPDGGALPLPLVAEVTRRCGQPTPFPACDRARPVEVRDGQTHRLGAGVYGDLKVTKGTLELAGGHYVFCALVVGRRAAVRADAPAEVHVAGDIQLARGAIVAPTPGLAVSANDVRVLSAGRSLRAGRGAEIEATLCAPDANVSLQGASLTGRIVGRRARVSRATLAALHAEEREPCAAFNPLRNPYFGDLHVHTEYSFDVRIFGASTTATEAYRFAQGDPLLVAPNDPGGAPTREIRLDRPLDFAAVTDHSEFLGEVETCSVPGTPGHDAPACVAYRAGGFGAFVALGATLYFGTREPGICGDDGSRCLELASTIWRQLRDAAEAANDRSATCRFASLLGYEFTAVLPTVSTFHRNVLFRNEQVPPIPITYFDARDRAQLWTLLRDQCIDAGTGCDVLAIPHNTNESNGWAFLAEYPNTTSLAEERAQAALGASMEPLVEIFQHKGDSECMNGLSGILGAPDEECDFEKRLRPPDDCGDGTGNLGAQDGGCLSRRDFVRGALLEGLTEQARLGVNPFRLGIIASTDTHNGASGFAAEDTYVGHQGEQEADAAGRLERDGGLINNPGGLAGVWAEERSRPAIFDALRRRETFGTSGPRIAVRFFGGYGLAEDLCSDPEMVAKAYATGVPMGGVLGAPPADGATPRFLVSAERDPGTEAAPGGPLERLQIVKTWITGGERHAQVFDVAGDTTGMATVDPATCARVGSGADRLCTVWSDPAFDPTAGASYYARVLETPRCRWSALDCLRLPIEARPTSCTDPEVPTTIRERAWSSPLWYEPRAAASLAAALKAPADSR